MISDITHPDYDVTGTTWAKWRYTYSGGVEFVKTYLQKLSTRESNDDFTARKNETYAPTHAKAAVNDIKNAIFQRLVDVIRRDGSKVYQQAVDGLNLGIDLRGRSMNSYMGLQILPELLVMGKVGVFVDMPLLNGETIADNKGKRPYLYTYACEDIRSYACDIPNEFSHLLLRDHFYDVHEDTRLPIGTKERYRYIKKENGVITVKYYDSSGVGTDVNNNQAEVEYKLDLDRIPFVLFELPESLMQDVADYQIALLNIESSDIAYIKKANFPFYVDAYDPRVAGEFFKPGGIDADGVGKDQEIKTGLNQGRRYPHGVDSPAFINPSAEPLLASMQKAERLKEDIRRLVNLAVRNLTRETDDLDEKDLEAGLSFIGLVLENGEKQIVEHWSKYEGSKPATIIYPQNYSLKTEIERQKEAKGNQELMHTLPSETFKREIGKRIALNLLSGKVKDEKLQKICDEIDKAPTMTSDPKVVIADFVNGFVGLDTASLARGYKPNEIAKAKVDHAERLKRINEAQGEVGGDARGVDDTQINQLSSGIEKVNKPKRGEAK